MEKIHWKFEFFNLNRFTFLNSPNENAGKWIILNFPFLSNHFQHFLVHIEKSHRISLSVKAVLFRDVFFFLFVLKYQIRLLLSQIKIHFLEALYIFIQKYNLKDFSNEFVCFRTELKNVISRKSMRVWGLLL